MAVTRQRNDPSTGVIMYGITFNYLAIAVTAVAALALGALWYHPALFGKAWLNAHEYTPTQLEAITKSMGRNYGVMFLTNVVMAFVLTALISLTGIIRWQGGLKLGVVCWLGFVATTGLTGNLFSGKKFAAYPVDAGYQLVYMMVAGAILAAWR